MGRPFFVQLQFSQMKKKIVKQVYFCEKISQKHKKIMEGEEIENTAKEIDVIPTYSIRRAKKTDVTAFLLITKDCEIASDKFSKIIELAQKGLENANNQLNDEILSENTSLRSKLEALEAELKEMAGKQPEVIEVHAKLTGAQFICSPHSSAALIARKYRPFLIKKGFCKSESFLDDLFNISVPFFIKENF